MTTSARSRVPTPTRNRVKRLVHDGMTNREISDETGVSIRTIQRLAKDEEAHTHSWSVAGTYIDAIAGFSVVQSCVCGDVRAVAHFPVIRMA